MSIQPRGITQFVLIGLAVTAFFASAPTQSQDDPGAEAIALYDAGKYAQAQTILESLDGDDGLNGPLLYRLYFCQRQAKNPAARKTMLRAREALQAEVDSGNDLESTFYLANIHRNTGRLSEAAKVAQVATARVEAGEIDAPATDPNPT